ncbi:alanyl-tRNA editing protein [Dialister succinatiphilus]|uniref:alanyl-tRNA editing protein n=1 Tax=Dialister succinatiphilus TaxID=487173 RepID=UPI002355764B|nr:alanine--tRNA ligase-related protein [Dialister succinatiphilus]MCI6030231.1 alanine--tRNA ligase-related protein [Dialister succinatiphilus]
MMDEMNELFYKDAYMKDFDGVVVSCAKGKKGYEVVLDDTAFYPEGGGQPGDQGTLGDARVLDVHRKEGVVVHYTDKLLDVGSRVHGTIDWQRRFDFMQNHSGEHIYSGLVHKKFGYDNVGFHMDKVVTVDFSGPMTMEEALEIEKEANQLIYSNVETKITFPTEEELKTIPYRSKIELTGKVRIVEFPGGDICACCGTHVARTGEIGLIKVLSLMNHKGGVRIELACGRWAMEDYDRVHDLNRDIAVRFSVKPYETVKAVEKMEKDMAELRQKINDMNRHYFAMRASSLPEGKKAVLLYEETMVPMELRKFCEYLVGEKPDTLFFLLSRKDEKALNYAIGSGSVNLKPLLKEWNTRLHGRGGGKDIMQGSFSCSLDEVRKLVEELE